MVDFDETKHSLEPREHWLEVRDQLRNLDSRINRFLLGGNAGGTIAAISFIGSSFRETGNFAYPPEVFVGLVAFLFGLFSSGMGLVLQRMVLRTLEREIEWGFMDRTRAEEKRTVSEWRGSISRRLMRVEDILAWTSAACLIVGAAVGVFVVMPE